MDKLLSLYRELNSDGVKFYTWDMEGEAAATIRVDGKYGIFMDFDAIRDAADELATLAHEGGHVKTGAIHKVYSPFDLVEKHEYKADKWAVQKVVAVEELDEAVAEGCCEMWELAEHFGVTEEFMRKIACWYTYGNLAVEEYMGF